MFLGILRNPTSARGDAGDIVAGPNGELYVCTSAGAPATWAPTNGLVAPLTLPATPSAPLKTQGGITLDNGYGSLWVNSGTLLVGYSGDTKFIGAGTPSLSVNPPVSGTVYQNPNVRLVQLVIPAIGGSTAGTLQFALGSSSSPPAFGAPTTVPAGQTVNFTTPLIPANWYWSVTVSGGATIGTVSVIGY